MQNAGRESRDFQRRFITEPDVFRAAVLYLTELVTAHGMEELRREDFSGELVDPQQPLANLSYFYNDGLPEVE